MLEMLGFHALATTSSGMAWSMGCADNHVPLERVLDHVHDIAAAVSIPVSADFEGGFAPDADGVHANVSAAATSGIAGLSIEDSTGDATNPLYEFDLAVDRVRAARRAIDASGNALVLVGRSEGFITGRPDLAETIRRLVAYADAGANCLYAPGLRRILDIDAIVEAVAPTPVNVGVGSDFTSVDELARHGVRRISVGGALARAAWRGFLDAANEIAEQGTFTQLARATPSFELERRFS
jgi:methylisocitrate lyase